MVDERITALRTMATHQGFRLKASRRRKPGGDFGKFGLEDADGAPVLGIGTAGLEASADAVETFLRDRTRASWASSTKGLKRSKAPPALPPKPPEPPKPRFKPVVANLFAKLPSARRAEAVTELVAAKGVRIERIVSAGQSTPKDAPIVRDSDLWLIVLAGDACVRIADSDPVVLAPGDHVTIAARQEYWITQTSVDLATVWLAVEFG